MFVASSGLYSFNSHYYVCSLIQPASLFTHIYIILVFRVHIAGPLRYLIHVWKGIQSTICRGGECTEWQTPHALTNTKYHKNNAKDVTRVKKVLHWKFFNKPKTDPA